MACAIVATAGAANANAYATITEGNTYFESHPYPTTWENAGDDEKCRALVMATKMLNAWFEWAGTQSSMAQALPWPRRGVLKPNVSEYAGTGSVPHEWNEPSFAILIPSNEIPAQVREATIELASALLASNRQADSDVETQGIESLTAGPVSLTFKTGVMAKPIPDAVMVLASQVGRKKPKDGTGTVHMYRA